MIPIYSAEKDIADQIAKASVTFCSQLTTSFAADLVGKENLEALAKVLAAEGYQSSDLVAFSSILCTVGTTNKNDDHLLAEEVWPARHTPANKQINYEHNERDIIGHMSNSVGMDEEGNTIADDSTIDALPGKFHIVDHGYLYNTWAADDLKQRMSQMLASIQRGELFVSMEALFKNFDYLLVDQQTNASELVRRDAQTAFLTKYLRFYGGEGVYKDKKIARVLRHMTFCGKGIVKRPANPESIILNDTKIVHSVWPTKPVDLTLGPDYKWIEKEINGDIKTMSATATELKPVVDQATLDKVEALTKALEQSQKEKAEANAKAEADAKANAEKELSDLRDQVKAKAAEVESVSKQLAVAVEAAKQSEVKIAELEAQAKTLAEEIATEKLNQKVASRIAQLTNAGKSKDDAEKMVATFDSLGDTAFAELVEVISAAFKMKDKDKDDDEEDSAKSNVEDLSGVTVASTLVGNVEAPKDEEYRGLASLFETELRTTASLNSK